MSTAHAEIEHSQTPGLKKQIIASSHIAASNNLVVERCGARCREIRTRTG
jgi:hypothetical protein